MTRKETSASKVRPEMPCVGFALKNCITWPPHRIVNPWYSAEYADKPLPALRCTQGAFTERCLSLFGSRQFQARCAIFNNKSANETEENADESEGAGDDADDSGVPNLGEEGHHEIPHEEAPIGLAHPVEVKFAEMA